MEGCQDEVVKAGNRLPRSCPIFLGCCLVLVDLLVVASLMESLAVVADRRSDREEVPEDLLKFLGNHFQDAVESFVLKVVLNFFLGSKVVVLEAVEDFRDAVLDSVLEVGFLKDEEVVPVEGR